MPRHRGPDPTVFERRAQNAAAVDHALAGATHQVFWLDGLSRPTHPELIDQHAADLVVVGAGYTGSAPSSARPGRAGSRMRPGSPGWASAPPGSPPT